MKAGKLVVPVSLGQVIVVNEVHVHFAIYQPGHTLDVQRAASVRPDQS